MDSPLQPISPPGAPLASWTGITQGEEPAPRLPEPAENALFRIAQEALTNVAKHAHASHVLVKLAAGDEVVRLAIADDGDGFDPAQLNAPDGHQGWGLLTMTERAGALGCASTPASVLASIWLG